MSRPLLLAAALALAGCHAHDAPHEHGGADPHADEGGHGHGPPGTPYTRFGDATELFVEVPPLVAGEATELAAHVTLLDGFRPLSAGRVTVELAGDGPPARFEGAVSETPGIFLVRVAPATAGRRRLAIAVSAPGLEERHDVGEVTVHAEDPPPGPDPGEEAPEGITFTKEQQWRMDFATAPVRRGRVREAFEAYGTLVPRAGGEARVAAPVAGRVVAESALPRTGQAVGEGETLLRLEPRSPAQADTVTLEAAVAQARLDLRQAAAAEERLAGLLADGAVPERRVVDARFETSRARAALAAARRRLAQAERVDGAGDGEPGVPLRAPIAGVVAEVRVAPGVQVEEGAELLRLVDLATLWLEVHVAETHAGALTGARGLWFEVEGVDGTFEAGPEDLVAVGPSLDRQSRTLPLYARVPNPDGRLREGMFARVHVVVGEAADALTVPAGAIVREGGLPVVYVQRDGERFERRQVRLGARDGDAVAVVDGLAAGERVVSRGAWAVRLAAAGTAVPAHGHAH